MRVVKTFVNASVYGLVISIGAGLVLVLGIGLVGGLGYALLLGLGFALVGPAAGWIRHFALRAVLVREGALPWRTVAFLLFAADLLFLRRNRDLIEFRHLLLRDHLASTAMTPDHIARLAREAEQRAREEHR